TSPGATSTRRTVPGIGAVTVLSPLPDPCAAPEASTSGGGAGLGGGRLRRHGVRQASGARTSGSGESGGCSVRNAVVAVPVRTSGGVTSQLGEGGVVGRAAALGSGVGAARG